MRDNSIVNRHLEIVAKYYPDMNITQLGMVSLFVGILRSALGHEQGKGTVENYIHHKYLSKDVKKCLDYLEREVLAIKRSRIDIDYYKIGNKSRLRRNKNKEQVSKI